MSRELCEWLAWRSGGSVFVAANNEREWHECGGRAKEMRIFTLCIIILIFAVGWTFRSFSVCVFFFIVGGTTKLPRLILLPSFFSVLSFRFVFGLSATQTESDAQHKTRNDFE